MILPSVGAPGPAVCLYEAIRLLGPQEGSWPNSALYLLLPPAGLMPNARQWELIVLSLWWDTEYSSNDITASAESNEDPVTRRGWQPMPKSGNVECLNAELAQRHLKSGAMSVLKKKGNHLEGALVKSPGEPPFTHHRADLFFQNPARKCEMLIKNILSHRGSKVAREVPFDRLFVQQLNQHT